MKKIFMGKSKVSMACLALTMPFAASAVTVSPTTQLGPQVIANTQIRDQPYASGKTVKSESISQTSGKATSFIYNEGNTFGVQNVPLTSIANVSAGFGGLHVYAASGMNESALDFAQVKATATFLDPLTILSSGGRPVRGGVVNFSFNLATAFSGGLYQAGFNNVFSFGEVTWDVGLYDGFDRIAGVTGDTLYSGAKAYDYPETKGLSGSALGLQAFAVQASQVISRPLSLVATISCTAYWGGICNASRSLEWGGMTYTDDAGNDLGPLSAMSDSGVDYAQPNDAFTAEVPEPASWAMMVMGFGTIGFAMRSRRKTVATLA